MANIPKHHFKSCAKKIRYKSRSIAKQAAREMTEKKPDSYFHAYRCPVCWQWHIGKDFIRKEIIKREKNQLIFIAGQ
jgi:hypothetical protein